MCDEGFTLRGSEIRQCLSNGTWSGNDTLCDGKQIVVRQVFDNLTKSS